jgi:hypothetical protein
VKRSFWECKRISVLASTRRLVKRTGLSGLSFMKRRCACIQFFNSALQSPSFVAITSQQTWQCLTGRHRCKSFEEQVHCHGEPPPAPLSASKGSGHEVIKSSPEQKVASFCLIKLYWNRDETLGAVEYVGRHSHAIGLACCFQVS